MLKATLGPRGLFLEAETEEDGIVIASLGPFLRINGLAEFEDVPLSKWSKDNPTHRFLQVNFEAVEAEYQKQLREHHQEP